MTKIFFYLFRRQNPFFLWFFLTSTSSICKNATAVEYAEMQRKGNCERALSSVSASFIRLLYILFYPQFSLCQVPNVGWLLPDSWQNSTPPIHHIFIQFSVPFGKKKDKNMARPGFKPTINQSKANSLNHWTTKSS